MSNVHRNPDTYYRWPRHLVAKKILGITTRASVFDIDTIPEKHSEYRGEVLRRYRHRSFKSILNVLIEGYINNEWLSVAETADKLVAFDTPEFDRDTSNRQNTERFQALTRRYMGRLVVPEYAISVYGDRWQYHLDFPVTHTGEGTSTVYSPYGFQDISPLHAGKFMLTNAGYIMADIARKPPDDDGRRVRNFTSTPVNLNPVIG